MRKLLERLRRIRADRKAQRIRRQEIQKARREVKEDRKRIRRDRNLLQRRAADIARALEQSAEAVKALEADDELVPGDPRRLKPAERRELNRRVLSPDRIKALEARAETSLDDAAERESRLVELARRRRELSAELADVEGRFRKLTRRASRLHRRITKRRRRRSLDRVVAFDGTPVTKSIALMLEAARARGWAGSLTSANREEGVAEKFGKMSQAALYRCWTSFQATGNCSCSSCNPANPPGRSTHELRDDGIYGGPVGRKLEAWQLGIDTTDADRLRAIARELGFDLRRPYPDAREQHHSNLFDDPRAALERLGAI